MIGSATVVDVVVVEDVDAEVDAAVVGAVDVAGVASLVGEVAASLPLQDINSIDTHATADVFFIRPRY